MGSFVVFLDAPFQILIDRCLQQEQQGRAPPIGRCCTKPRLRGRGIEERRVLYARHAQRVIDVGDKAPALVAQEIWLAVFEPLDRGVALMRARREFLPNFCHAARNNPESRVSRGIWWLGAFRTLIYHPCDEDQLPGIPIWRSAIRFSMTCKKCELADGAAKLGTDVAECRVNRGGLKAHRTPPPTPETSGEAFQRNGNEEGQLPF